MKEKIAAELCRIEREHNVEILYAVESGSRAWGFASRDSDYDVRFIYQRPLNWYLSIEDKRDVIEEPISGDLDISGWDLRKALALLRKTNPALLEWLRSPIVYCENREFTEPFRKLAEKFFTPSKCFLHYLHMAEGNHDKYLLGDMISLKKYFYVLRPVCACLWIERGFGTVPMEFSALMEKTINDAALRNAIDELLIKKSNGDELDHAPKIPIISDFLATEIARLKTVEWNESEALPVTELDAFFAGRIIR